MKVVYDTCLYIDFLRSRSHEDFFLDRNHIRFLSPVVMMELLAGSKTNKDKNGLKQLFKPYIKSDRVIQFGLKEYFQAGEILSRIRKKDGTIKPGFSHDVLIALSASSVGATVLTANKKDFERIRKAHPYKLEIA